MGPVTPCELAANVSVQGRGRASERDSEGSRLSRVQRQRGWLDTRPLRRPDWRKMYKWLAELPTFVTLRVSVSVPAKSPIAREATFKSLGLSEKSGVLQCSASALANASPIARAAEESEPVIETVVKNETRIPCVVRLNMARALVENACRV